MIYTNTYNAAIKTIVTSWDGYATSTQFREGVAAVMDTVAEHTSNKILVDLKKMVLIGREDQQWMTDVVLPEAASHGITAIALIQPLFYFNRVAVESIAFKLNQKTLTMFFFDNMEDAIAWLESLDK